MFIERKRGGRIPKGRLGERQTKAINDERKRVGGLETTENGAIDNGKSERGRKKGETGWSIWVERR